MILGFVTIFFNSEKINVMLCNVNVSSVPYLPILQQGNAELGKLVNVRLRKLNLFQSQNIHDEITK